MCSTRRFMFRMWLTQLALVQHIEPNMVCTCVSVLLNVLCLCISIKVIQVMQVVTSKLI